MSLVPEQPQGRELLSEARMEIRLHGYRSLSEAVSAIQVPIRKMGIALHIAFRGVNYETHDVLVDRNNSYKYGNNTFAINFPFAAEEVQSAPDTVKQIFTDLELEPTDQIQGILVLNNTQHQIEDEGWYYDLRFEVGKPALEDGKSGLYITSTGAIGLIPTPTENPYRSDLERKNNHLFAGVLNSRFGNIPHPFTAQALIDAGYMIGMAIETRRRKRP